MAKIDQLVIGLFKDKPKSFATMIRLYDVDDPFRSSLNLHRPIPKMATPLYYAALLGLGSVLNNMLPAETEDSGLSEIINVQGG